MQTMFRNCKFYPFLGGGATSIRGTVWPAVKFKLVYLSHPSERVGQINNLFDMGGTNKLLFWHEMGEIQVGRRPVLGPKPPKASRRSQARHLCMYSSQKRYLKVLDKRWCHLCNSDQLLVTLKSTEICKFQTCSSWEYFLHKYHEVIIR